MSYHCCNKDLHPWDTPIMHSEFFKIHYIWFSWRYSWTSLSFIQTTKKIFTNNLQLWTAVGLIPWQHSKILNTSKHRLFTYWLDNTVFTYNHKLQRCFLVMQYTWNYTINTQLPQHSDRLATSSLSQYCFSGGLRAGISTYIRNAPSRNWVRKSTTNIYAILLHEVSSMEVKG